MANYKMIIRYDGTNYSGWQKQGNTTNTIQGKIEFHIGDLLGEAVEVHGSGRTDAGVHAKFQVANFFTNKLIERDSFLLALNERLPKDISITKLETATERFHARLNTTSKTYVYYIDNAKIADPFRRKYSLHIDTPLNIDAMQSAAALLVGKHDFKSFCGNKNMKKSTVRTIHSINISKDESDLISIEYKGDGFLYNMARILTGTLINVGINKTPVSDITKILEGKNRKLAGPTAFPHGLFLENVEYTKVSTF